MPYNPNIHHRRSIRLKGYDYSQEGLYFVTICVNVGTNLRVRPNLFGEIEHGKMILNDAGKMIEKWCGELSHKFSDIVVDTYIVMPNHFHAIIVNTGVPTVGADLRVCPDKSSVCPDKSSVCPDKSGVYPDKSGVCPDKSGVCPDKSGVCPDKSGVCPDKSGVYPDKMNENILGEHGENILGEHIGSPLHRVVQWFKTMSTNEYIRGVKTSDWQPFNKKLWQRNYFEIIIRDEKSYQYIANYIINNPAKWENDKFYEK